MAISWRYYHIPGSRKLAQVLPLRLQLPDGPQNMAAGLFSSAFVRGHRTAHSTLASAGLASTTLLLDDRWRGFNAGDEPRLVVGREAYRESGHSSTV
jgi:hypothetical protein